MEAQGLSHCDMPFFPSEAQTCLRGCQHQADSVTALSGLRESRREPVGACWGWGGREAGVCVS